MNLKRNLTALIGFPIVVLTLIYGNKYIIDALLTIVAIICMNEYYSVIEKVSHPIKWVGYASTVLIFLTSLISFESTLLVVLYSIPIILLILFLHVILTEMKTNFKDAAYTFLGIFYITYLIIFLALITDLKNGAIYFIYILLVAWATDVFAYWVGKPFGKHHFSKVSPKKSVEGSIAGIVGSTVICLIYALIVSNFIEFNGVMYLYVAIVTLLLSVISQIGDFVASSIKRFANIKDFGNILPGHGGMLDRIDSVLFISPFVFMIISLF